MATTTATLLSGILHKGHVLVQRDVQLQGTDGIAVRQANAHRYFFTWSTFCRRYSDRISCPHPYAKAQKQNDI